METSAIRNKIVRGILDEFTGAFRVQGAPESKRFERLVNYVVLSRVDPEAFSEPSVFDFVDVDGGGTFGIDAFALFVNDSLITSPEDIEVQRKSRKLDVRLVFLQSKRSSGVDAGDLLKFTASVRNILAENPSVPVAGDLKNARNLIEEIFKSENARLFSAKPKCELVFAHTGGEVSDEKTTGLMLSEERAILAAVPELREVKLLVFGADSIIDSYNEIENRFRVALTFEKQVPCEKISDVEQAFVGYLPASEFLKLIEGSDGTLRRHVFYENVRDFQGLDNSVNSEIASTLSDDSMFDKFILLNNGVTVVAREFINVRATEYEIGDYYIVNGCQTSNVIYSYREMLRGDRRLKVPVKIIHTKSNDLIARVIRSTNRQTPVPDEAFASLEKFHKRLQEFYRVFSQSSSDALYYERRSREYSTTLENADRPRIVNLHAQIRSFTALMLGEPHLVMARNPSTVLREHSGRIFQPDHKYVAYFLPALLLFYFQKLQADGCIDGKYALSRYWIAWLVRMIVFGSVECPPINSRKIEEKCDAVVSRLRDEDYRRRVFEAAIETFERCRIGYLEQTSERIANNELIRLKAFRDFTRDFFSNELKDA